MAFVTDSAGGYAQLEDVAPPSATKQVLSLRAIDHPYYVLAYHPLRWGLFVQPDGAGEWLPVLRRVPLVPGSNNIDKDGSPHAAFAIMAQEGWEILPVDVVPGTSYIKGADGIGGKIHLSAWHKVKQIGSQVLLTTDEGGYRDWLRTLCKVRGYAPDSDALLLKRQTLEREWAEDHAASATDPKAKARAEALKRSLDAMDKKAKPKSASEKSASDKGGE